jgi:hypothetical protein
VYNNKLQRNNKNYGRIVFSFQDKDKQQNLSGNKKTGSLESFLTNG